MVEWTQKKILVWGVTRPDLSNKYEEIVCTGGVFEDTRKFVRLYPVPLRLLEDTSRFHKYQWITVDVMSPPEDMRPESRRVNYESVKTLEKISPDGDPQWLKRAEWILADGNQFASVEALKAREEQDRTSLGIVKPKEITKFDWEPISDEDQKRFWDNYKRIVAQRHLFVEQDFRMNKPLPPPRLRFFVEFRCDDSACTKDHRCSILDWELDALWSHYEKDPLEFGAGKVMQKLDWIRDRDVRFFMGNHSAHRQTFMVVGLWYPAKAKAPKAKRGEDKSPGLFG